MVQFLTLLVVFVILLIIYNVMVSNGKKMKDKFHSLGEITGKSKSEIIESFGECTTDIRVNDTTICKWGTGNYVITLTFDSNDKVISVGERTDTFWS